MGLGGDGIEHQTGDEIEQPGAEPGNAGHVLCSVRTDRPQGQEGGFDRNGCPILSRVGT